MSQPKSLVLLGIGHTNAHVVKQWATDPIPGCRLICISRFPTATYSGMFPGTLGWQFRDDEMRIDLQGLADRAGAELIFADTNGLDLDAGELHFSDHDSIPFDALSIGVGSMPVGWQQHLKSPIFTPIKPMQSFLERLRSRLEPLNRPSTSPIRIAIVGGGVASVEISFCLHEQISRWESRRPASIEIFTSSEHVADGMKPRSVSRLEKLLNRRGIAVHTGCRVSQVGERDLQTEDGKRFESDCVIWATGATAPPVLGQLGLETDPNGFVATHRTLQSLSDPRVFAVGDSGTVMDSPAPKAGVYAVRQCPILWHNLRSFLSGETLQTYHPQHDFLKLVNTGDGKALLQYHGVVCHARWCWKLKTWIDKKFVREFQR